ncbi:MAG: lamin tail domain-containing protein, partial [Bacteroidota bacterium]
ERLLSSGCVSPPLPELVISKINYHPSSNTFNEDDLEFIEITNNGSNTVDLTGVYFGGTGLVYQFPAGSSLPSGQSVLLANNTETFVAAYNRNPFGEFSRNLSNAGQRIELLDAWGEQIDLVEYDDEAPWPISADGEGTFLELNNLNVDNNEGSNWTVGETDNIVTTIREHSKVSVYPNPNQGYINIENESIINQLRLHGLDGKLILQAHPNSRNYQIKTSAIKEGVYLLLLTDQKGTLGQKVIVQN